MRRRNFYSGVIILLLLVLALTLVPRLTVKTQANIYETNTGLSTDIKQPSKKLIEYGWDVPSPAFVSANIRTMEQRPFDGIVVRLSVGPYIFRHTPYADSKFDQDRQDLKATTFTHFTDNFLIVWASSEQGWNWLSDSDWAAAEQNLRNFARTAAAGGFKGILFDSETYGPNTWEYNTNTYANKSMAQVQNVVRQRGARFMTILQSELPASRVLFTWLLGNLPLQNAFVEGMFSATIGDARLIDGNESSYNYTDAKAFDESRSRLVDNINHLGSDYRDAARAHLQLGQAIYTDALLNLLNSPRSIGFYFDNQQGRLLLLEHNVYHALRTSDEYVWFYSENVDWWKKPSIPDGLEDAIRRAQAFITSGQSPAYDTHLIEAASKAWSQMVTISGKVVTKDDKPFPHVIIQTGFRRNDGMESACFTYAINLFDCKFPNGWSGTLTPLLDGYQFDPPSLSVNNLAKDTQVKFTAIPVTTK